MSPGRAISGIEEVVLLIVGANRNRVLVIANVAASAQLALLGFRNKRLCLGKQFHDSIAAFWTLAICCNHTTSLLRHVYRVPVSSS
jgi:hypothetical protein